MALRAELFALRQEEPLASAVRHMATCALALSYGLVKNPQAGTSADTTVTIATQLILPGDKESLTTRSMRCMT